MGRYILAAYWSMAAVSFAYGVWYAIHTHPIAPDAAAGWSKLFHYLTRGLFQ